VGLCIAAVCRIEATETEIFDGLEKISGDPQKCWKTRMGWLNRSNG
jgi:hypothetical protein